MQFFLRCCCSCHGLWNNVVHCAYLFLPLQLLQTTCSRFSGSENRPTEKTFILTWKVCSNDEFCLHIYTETKNNKAKCATERNENFAVQFWIQHSMALSCRTVFVCECVCVASHSNLKRFYSTKNFALNKQKRPNKNKTLQKAAKRTRCATAREWANNNKSLWCFRFNFFSSGLFLFFSCDFFDFTFVFVLWLCITFGSSVPDKAAFRFAALRTDSVNPSPYLSVVVFVWTSLYHSALKRDRKKLIETSAFRLAKNLHSSLTSFSSNIYFFFCYLWRKNDSRFAIFFFGIRKTFSFMNLIRCERISLFSFAGGKKRKTTDCFFIVL